MTEHAHVRATFEGPRGTGARLSELARTLGVSVYGESMAFGGDLTWLMGDAEVSRLVLSGPRAGVDDLLHVFRGRVDR